MNEQSWRKDSPWRLRIIAVLALAGIGLACGGCSQGETASVNGNAAGQTGAATGQKSGQKPAAEKSSESLPPGTEASAARGVLEGMVAAYKKATAYADKGTVRLQAKEGEQKVDQSAEYTVVFARPNRIRMRVYEGVMVSNGKDLSAFANNVANQVVKRPAPAKLGIKEVFADEMLGGALSGAVSQAPTQAFSWVPLPLLLLVADDPLKTLLHRSAEPVLLQPGKIDEIEYDRVELPRPDGKAVLWIDRQSHVLRRVQLPVDEILKSIPPEQNVKDLSLTVELAEARFQDQVDDSAFQFEIPADARVLETLMPPALLLLGNPTPEFSFTGADGKPMTPASLKGKIAVLDFWATWCGPCRVKLPMVEKVYAKYKNNDKVAFVAVSVDKPEVKEKDLQTVFSELGVSLPVARDPQQDAGKKFYVSAIPATCILGPDGTVQDYQAGFRPTHDTDLTTKLEKLLAGGSIHQEPMKQLQEERKMYAGWLDKWVKDELFLAPTADEQELPKVSIAPRNEPKAIQLTPLWKCKDLKSPGNIAVAADAGKRPRLLVLDSWKMLAELGADGKVLGSHSLELGEREAATFLRTFAASGKRYCLVSGAMQQQTHLFDENWKKILSFPEATPESPHAGIADAQLADLDGDGTPEIYIGYFGEVGVHAVSLEGKRLWANRSLTMVSRIAIVGPDAGGRGSLLCTNALGSLIALDSQGKRLEEYRVPNRLIHWLAGPYLQGEQGRTLAGLFLADLGASVAIGLGPKGEELWTHPLPKGVHQWPVEQIVPGNIAATGPGNWILPSPDGSIHILTLDGKLVDQFNYGEALTGLATMVVDNEPVLVIGSTKGVEALKISAK